MYIKPILFIYVNFLIYKILSIFCYQRIKKYVFAVFKLLNSFNVFIKYTMMLKQNYKFVFSSSFQASQIVINKITNSKNILIYYKTTLKRFITKICKELLIIKILFKCF